MSRRTPAALLLPMALAACRQPASPPAGALPTVELNQAIEASMGGTGACVVLSDVATGAVRYQYGLPSVCMRPLPPCATDQVADSLIGLDTGAATTAAVLRWDGSPQPVKAWERDADLRYAFSHGVGWWFDRLRARIGPAERNARLKAYGLDQPLVSTRQQASFIRRLYGGTLPVKPRAAAAVETLMSDESRGAATISGKTGSCDTALGGSRGVGWWIGRLKAPGRDLAFAASFESENALPGAEVEDRLKGALADAGLWPRKPD